MTLPGKTGMSANLFKIILLKAGQHRFQRGTLICVTTIRMENALFHIVGLLYETEIPEQPKEG